MNCCCARVRIDVVVSVDCMKEDERVQAVVRGNPVQVLLVDTRLLELEVHAYKVPRFLSRT